MADSDENVVAHPTVKGSFQRSRRSKQPKSGDDQSEDSVALEFTARYGNSLRFDHNNGTWLEWDGTRWKRDGVSRAFHYARELSRMLGGGEKGICRSTFAKGVERFAQADPVHAVESLIWDQDPMLLGTPGGTVDLRTGILRAADPEDFITKQTSVTPLAGRPDLWLAFLDEALGHDEEAVRFVRQWFGYCLTGRTTEHALAYVHGSGGNGKTVYLNSKSRIMGDYAITAAMETFTASKNDRHSTELAMLQGARLVTASETEEGRAWAESRIKLMTGGDPITARFMRRDNFTYTPQFKITIAGNHAPQLRNVDDAMRRRFNIIPFTNKPKTPDRELEEKLRAEHPQILNWAIEGTQDWLVNGLLRPNIVTEATTNYFDDQDSFGQWIADRCIVGESEFEIPGKLYKDWCSFAKEAGEETGSMKSFCGLLDKRGHYKHKTGGIRVRKGIALREPPPSYDRERDGWDG